MSLDYPDPDLADEWIRLREWRLEDGALLREVALADPFIVAITSVPADPSRTAIEDYIRRQWSRQPSGQGPVPGHPDWLLAEPDIFRVEAHAVPENAASLRTLERAGFRREGLLHSYLQVGDARADAVVMSRLRGDAAN